MATRQTQTKTREAAPAAAQTVGGGLFETLEELPPELEAEAAPAKAVLVPVRSPEQPRGGPLEVNELAYHAPDKVESYLRKVNEAHALLRQFSIRSTAPIDWVLFRDREGSVVATLTSSGALKVRKLLGISIGNYRPTTGQVAEPQITSEQVDLEDRDGKLTGKTITVLVGEMWADGHCAKTGEDVTDVYFALRSKDQQGKQNFTGRGHLQDLKAAVRTGVDTKVVRLLSGLSKVDVEALVAGGIVVDKCRKGAGYGTASERTAKGVADTGADFEARKKRFKNELLRRTGGDESAARDLLKDCTKWKGQDGTERWTKSVDQFTQGFQLEKAEKALLAHPNFGAKDFGALPAIEATNGHDSPPSERQAGEEG